MDDTQHEVIVLDSDTPSPAFIADDEVSCKNDVLLIFPNICPDYLAELAFEHSYKSDAVISVILDKQEQGAGYPTQKVEGSRCRKRKREDGVNPGEDSDGESGERDPESVRSIKLKMAADDYAATTASPTYLALARVLISQDFPLVPQNTIRNLLLENNRSAFDTYTAMDDKLRNRGADGIPWVEKKTSSKKKDEFAPETLPNLDLSNYKVEEQAALAEFMAARELRAMKDAKEAAKAEEVENFLRAQAENQTSECEICFEECALNTMVPCEGDPMHWFCRSCMRHQAESQIGMGKFEITCMSQEGCSAGFSRTQKALFLDKKLTIALDRIEQEVVLRMAGIENLETCPFCPYAAEYPPVEVDKEFRCENPDCEQVSCRLCRRLTHIPKSCAEEVADRGLDARHVLEEAMSEALIRRCNNCKNPFVKQDGCNKIKCTKCNTLQCDVCRQTIKDYTHFNDQRRGGKAGRCPLFDHSEERYEQEVSSAEAEMRKKVVEENPGMNESVLRIETSDKVKQDDHRRIKTVPIAYQHWQRNQALADQLPQPQVLELPGRPPLHPPFNRFAFYMPPALGNNNPPLIPGRERNPGVPPNPAPPPPLPVDVPNANEALKQGAPPQLHRPPHFAPVNFGHPNGLQLTPRQLGFGNIFHKIDRIKTMRMNNREANGAGQADPRPLFQQPVPPQVGAQPPGAAVGIAPRMNIPFQLPPGFVPHAFNAGIPLANRPMNGGGPADPLPIPPGFQHPARDQNGQPYRR